MKLQINASSWNLSRDTEFLINTELARKFLNDHGVAYDIVTVGGESKIEYHESVAVVSAPLETVSDIREYCKKYDAKIELQDETALITFL